MKLAELTPSAKWALEELARLIASGETGKATIEYSQCGVKEVTDERRKRPPKDVASLRDA